MQYEEVMARLRSLANPANVAGMARFGISTRHTYGIPVPALRALAKEIGRDHGLAQQLWSSGVHEARILASMVADPKMVSEEQMERWVRGFDSWDVCDQCCSNLFDKTPFAYKKAAEWCSAEEEFVKRAGFALIAALAVHDKKARDEQLTPFLPLIAQGATDERNLVKKAVNWALRQMGKRNLALNRMAIDNARAIQQLDSRAAKWIASDALRELTGEAVQRRLGAKAHGIHP
ncbi:MAG: DNA alkylation repair protein [Chloroflexi bacterium]|nr:DNA alkylation repair protein [Chloroflexota bacterium]